MKVMFLVNIPSPYRVNFFNELSRYCDLTVVFEKTKSNERDEKWLSDEGIRFNAVFLDGIRIRNKLVYSKKLIDIARQDWDIVVLGIYMITPAIYLNYYFSKKKKPFYIQADGGLIKNDNWLMKKVKRTLISKATGWLTSGPETTRYFVHYGAIKERCYEYPFSSVRDSEIVLSLSERKRLREETRIQLGYDDTPVILTVGQFIPRKGFDILLHAISKMKNSAKVVFVGGVPTSEYHQLCEKLNLNNIIFEGFKSKSELSLYYKAADIFVLPTREDVWGLVINEAMAYGLPVVTTDRCVAGLELIENEKNGYIFETDNVDELARCIDTLLGNDQLCDKMSEKNIERIHGYTIETMALEHKKIFEKLVQMEAR